VTFFDMGITWRRQRRGQSPRAAGESQEPLDAFSRYMAVYAREQAYWHFSPALIANLERHWNAQNRKP
jgi:thioesterase DpgC